MTTRNVNGSLNLACWIAALALAGCGGKGGHADSDASDTVPDDSSGDTANDPSPDVDADATPDTPADSTTDPSDTAGDSDADPIEDTSADGDPDSTGDVTGDPFEDWPTDLPPDWTEDTSPECDSAGGFCSGARWELCPIGYEAIAGIDPNLGCDVNGWCCVPAPPSTCSASGWTNCVAASSCTDCWDDPGVAGLACEEGRVCCYDICD